MTTTMGMTGKDKENPTLNLLHQLNGNFAIVSKYSDRLFAAVDQCRSIPLFYGQKDRCFFLSDDAQWIRLQVGDSDLDPLSIKEFMLTGYVTGPNTLFPNVKQLQAGECLWVQIRMDKPELTTHRYYRWIHGDYFNASEEELCVAMDRVHLRVFERLLETTKGYTIIIPLSGGYDSRLIATMLKRLGRDDVICFSYGKANNWESKISQQVSTTLGYPWLFVPYTRKKWREWFNSSELFEYTWFGSGLCSLEHTQDFPAVWTLKQQGYLPENSIFVPGHTGDFISGGHLSKDWGKTGKIDNFKLLSWINQKHYAYWKLDYQRFSMNFASKILSSLFLESWNTFDEMASLYESWEWQERQSKFIINSVRVYEFWGYEWRIPLWDKELMDFWAKVPLKYRIGKNLYNKYVQRLFREFGVDYEAKSSPRNREDKTGLKEKILGIVRDMKDPRLGQYSLRDHWNCLRFYNRIFPTNIPRSLRNIVKLNTMGTYTTLSRMHKKKEIRTL